MSVMKALALALLVALAGCASKPAMTHDLVFLSRGACVYTPAMRANLDAALTAMQLPKDYQFIDLDTLAKTDARVGYPTPTVLLADRDLFDLPRPTPPFPDAA